MMMSSPQLERSLLLLLFLGGLCDGLLYPKDTQTRQTKSLDGIWNFRLSPSLDPELGFRETWYARPLSETGSVMDMPVPSSYNDVTTDPAVRDFVGWAWYDRQFLTPSTWNTTDLLDARLRFGSAHFSAIVWLNGVEVARHEGGHLPFEADITGQLLIGDSANLLTVAVNNTLHPHTIPQGDWKWQQESESYPAGYFQMTYTFDFYNYAGIHRPVTLYAVPKGLSINDISVQTTVNTNLAQAAVNYQVDVDSDTDDFDCLVELLRSDGTLAAARAGCSGSLLVSNPNLWWPYLMDDNPGYLYTLDVTVFDSRAIDRYQLPVGLRQVTWDERTFKINHRDFYFRGFGKHEDSNIRGKGLDLTTVTKDFNLIKWLGANSFRTSHYPYAEEIMDFADRNGIVVIDECPGVNLEGYAQPLLDSHLQVMRDLIARDKNRPSVVMWSIANEPRSSVPAAREYFQTVADYTRELDPTRPVTCATNQPVSTDEAPYALDIIGINRYGAWYTDTGHLELIERQLVADIRAYNTKHNKPVLVLEFGADAIHGFHEVPSTIFTEEYQTDLMVENFRAFDVTRAEGNLVGEMIWNFADFMTKQEYHRAWGNRKGLFTRDRHPKASAHLMRARYWDLAAKLDEADNV